MNKRNFIVMGFGCLLGIAGMCAFTYTKPPHQDEINEETALTVLTDILSSHPIWTENPDVRLCIKYIGSRHINTEEKIHVAIQILTDDRRN